MGTLFLGAAVITAKGRVKAEKSRVMDKYDES
jgi:hypothetical protein